MPPKVKVEKSDAEGLKHSHKLEAESSVKAEKPQKIKVKIEKNDYCIYSLTPSINKKKRSRNCDDNDLSPKKNPAKAKRKFSGFHVFAPTGKSLEIRFFDLLSDFSEIK